MDEQTNMESAPNVGAGTPSPVSPVSGQQSSAEASEKSVTVQELAKRLEKLERMEQSAKDRAIAELRKRIDEISGKPPEPEKAEVIAPQSPGTTNAAQAIPEALARLSEVGLSIADPDVATIIGKVNAYPSRESFLLDIERSVTRKSIKPVVSPAVAVSSPGIPVQDKNEAELMREYQSKVIAARGQREVITALRDEYKKKGVPVEQAVFTIK